MRVLPLLIAFSTVLLGLSGCFGGSSPKAVEGAREFLPLGQVQFDGTGSFSMPVTPVPSFMENATHYAANIQKGVQLQVKSFDDTMIDVAVIRPRIQGCPEGLEGPFPDHCKTPVLMDAGPYFSSSSIATLSTRPPTGIWFVPHGYTMVYMAVRGTGGSGGCMEFMSLNEQKDVDHVVTWTATQAWSNGNVGMIGRSYDGTTPLMAAALGNPHLKTIVPISGVVDQSELMFANGTPEFRGPIMHSYVYWLTYGFQMEPEESRASQFCAEMAKGAVLGPYTTLTGDTSVAGMDEYWNDRDWGERVVQNYKGSVFVIHGMQDWNVNPRMVVPWINDLQDAGIRTKAWLGQWGHAYPDRADEHPNVRWDWAEVLLRWFDRELKGVEVDTGPAIEVEDHRHEWFVGDSYPPRNVTYNSLYLNKTDDPTDPLAARGGMGSRPGPAGTAIVAAATGADDTQPASFLSEVLPGPTRISGLVRLQLKVTPTTATGATVYTNLFDVYPDGRQVWLGHGWINLRYHEGTREAQPLVPGQPVLARMQFEPLEGYLSEGHRVRLTISQDMPFAAYWYGGSIADNLVRPEQGPFIVHAGGDSVLRLPLHDDFRLSPYHGYDIKLVP